MLPTRAGEVEHELEIACNVGHGWHLARVLHIDFLSTRNRQGAFKTCRQTVLWPICQANIRPPPLDPGPSHALCLHRSRMAAFVHKSKCSQGFTKASVIFICGCIRACREQAPPLHHRYNLRLAKQCADGLGCSLLWCCCVHSIDH